MNLLRVIRAPSRASPLEIQPRRLPPVLRIVSPIHLSAIHISATTAIRTGTIPAGGEVQVESITAMTQIAIRR